MTENPFDTPEVQDLQPTPGHNPFRWMQILGVVSVLWVLGALLLPAVTRGPAVRRTARRVPCMNPLKQIRLVLDLYHDAYQALAPAYTNDSNGQKLHSWRTLILPFMERATLYKQIDLSRPWNAPINFALASQMPEQFRCPEADSPAAVTTYLGAVGEDFCFHPTTPLSLKEFSDGLSKTLMVFEVSPKMPCRGYRRRMPILSQS